MKILSRDTSIRVTLTFAEFHAKDKADQEWLLDHSMPAYFPEGVHLYFTRETWERARYFFPQLQSALPRTWQNI